MRYRVPIGRQATEIELFNLCIRYFDLVHHEAVARNEAANMYP
jgi:hypothetical protein